MSTSSCFHVTQVEELKRLIGEALSEQDIVGSDGLPIAVSVVTAVVENVLTSTSAANALSANQGRNLKDLIDALSASKQDVLVSGSSIRTINGTTILGSGDIAISGGGGGASYPEVLNYAALPSSPAEGSTYVVLTTTGIPFINRKAAGLYRYSSGSYAYLGEVPEGYFTDNVLRFFDNADASKQFAFELGSITSGNTRTLTIPDKSGIIATLSDITGGAVSGAEIAAALNSYLGSSDWQGGAGGSALPALTAWSTTWDTAAYKDMGSYTVTGALAITSSDTGSVRGGCTQAVLVANGSNVPTMDGTSATVYGYVNTSGARNLVQLFRAGDAKFWSCGAYTGAVLSIPTAPSWPSAPTIGAAVVGSAASVTGAATGTAPITYTYQWTLDGSNISGATASSYTPVSGDATHTLRCVVTATNAHGSADGTSNAVTVSAAATVPDAPIGLTLGTATSTTQPLTWSAPASDGGSAITDYVIQYAPAGSGTWATFTHTASTAASITVTGLSASTSYDYRVAAVNSVGAGAYSSTATGSTGAATSLINIQLTTVIGLTQSGDATAGWNYTPTAANASFSGSNGGVSSLKIPSGAGGHFQAKLSGWSSGNGFHVGLKTTSATGSFNTTACGLYVRSSSVYNVSTGATGSQVPAGGALSTANGDMLRMERESDGTTCKAYKSSDNGGNWTLMHTWTGISGDLYCLINFGGAGVSALDVEGFGVS